MKKSLKIILLLIIPVLLCAMYFIPWYNFSYSLPYAGNGGEGVTRFTEWWSPFHYYFYESSNVGFIILFIAFLICPICSVGFGIFAIKNDKFKNEFYVSILISIVIFLIMIFIMIVFSPTM